MAIIEIILGERFPTGVQTPVEYSVLSEDFCATINGEIVREPVAPLRALFTKLKARDNLLSAVLARLGVDPGARESEAHAAVGRVLDAQSALDPIAKLARLDVTEPRKIAEWVLSEKKAADEWTDKLTGALTKIAQGLGLSATKPDDLAAQVLAMNTELTSALSSSQAEVKAFTEENARLRAEVEQERTAKLRAMTATDIAISRSAELERKIMELKAYLRGAGLNRARAEAKAVGLAAELDAAWTFIELHTGELRP